MKLAIGARDIFRYLCTFSLNRHRHVGVDSREFHNCRFYLQYVISRASRSEHLKNFYGRWVAFATRKVSHANSARRLTLHRHIYSDQLRISACPLSIVSRSVRECNKIVRRRRYADHAYTVMNLPISTGQTAISQRRLFLLM